MLSVVILGGVVGIRLAALHAEARRRVRERVSPTDR
jgi:hypothetical protein